MDPDPGIENSGSLSSYPPFRNIGSGSSDPHLGKVNPDPGPSGSRSEYLFFDYDFVLLVPEINNLPTTLSFIVTTK